jgi:hypothetical protein
VLGRQNRGYVEQHRSDFAVLHTPPRCYTRVSCTLFW